VPIILAAGNSRARHTGAWRFVRPVIDRAACTRCRICLLRCPDGALTLDAGGYPVIDYDNCKGCMICARECPIRCIHEEKEVRAW
jgi:pyruvate ferredoxin oxidoreductase gamma subunit